MSNVIAVDTTKNAKATPEKAQPWKELGPARPAPNSRCIR
ncbi:MAG: hypothetical protein RI919_1318 [Actinomycetota bacterium]